MKTMPVLSVLFRRASIPLALALAALIAMALTIAAPSAAWGVDAALSDNANDNNYTRWASTQKSHLHVNPSDNLERVEWVDGALVVEEYDADYQIVSSRTIDASTYTPSTMADGNSVAWGGFFAGSDNYFVVTGQNNPDESDALPVVRITKYTRSWEYVDDLEISGINTVIPFDAGSLRMLESGGSLYVRTCHEMYESGDGLNHQANMTFVVDQSSMTLTSSSTAVSNIGSSLGYVSHSFNQFLAQLGDRVYALDHGDAYPRSLVVKPLGTRSYVNVLEFVGQVGDNDTGASAGGFESSSVSGTLLAAYSSIDQADPNAAANLRTYARNARVSVYSPEDATLRHVSLTGYAADGSESAGTPALVKVGDNRFLVLWANYDRTDLGSGSVRFSADGTFSYTFLDGQGNRLSDVSTAAGSLSDCQPVVAGSKVVWYSTGQPSANSSYYRDSTDPIFYSIDAQDGSLATAGTLGFARIAGLESRTYTGSAIEPKPAVSVGGVALAEGVDYRLSYQDNVNAGTATVTVVGMGFYTGSASATFAIERRSIADATVGSIPGQTYTGSAIEPSLAVAVDGRALIAGADYSASFSSNVNAGTATVSIEGEGNYRGWMQVSFTIVPADLGEASISPIADQIFTGSAITPDVQVTMGERILRLGTDYDVSYANNVNVGAATVSIVGKGNYTGSETTTFQIVSPEPSDPSDPEDPGDPSGPASFSDVFEGVTDHYGHILWLTDNEISTGWDNHDGTWRFEPYSPVKRADMAAFLWRMAGEPEVRDAGRWTVLFDDIEGIDHYEAVLWCASVGITEGWDEDGDGVAQFRPYADIARVDMAAFLHRYSVAMGTEDLEGAGSFPDVPEGMPHAEDVAWLADAGITTGFVDADGNVTYQPYRDIVRCDMAAMLHRLDGYVRGYEVAG